MNKSVLLLLTAGFIGMQGCSSGGSTPAPGPGEASSSSSSSSGGASSSSSSSSSSGSGKVEADVQQARAFIQDLRTMTTGMNSDKGILTGLGSLLSGDDAANYDSFAASIEQSSFSGLSSQQLLSKDFANVSKAVEKAATAIGSKFFSAAYSEEIVAMPEGVSITTFEDVVSSSISNKSAFYTIGVKNDIALTGDDCKATLAGSCNVTVDLTLKISFPDSVPQGSVANPRVKSISLQNMHLDVVKFSASNPYLSLSMETSEDVLSIGSLQIGASLAENGEDLLSAEVLMEGLAFDMEIALQDLADAGTKVIANFDTTGQLIALTIDTAHPDKTVFSLVDLQGMMISGSVKAQNASDDNASLELSATPEVVGTLPFTYELGEQFETLESDTDFLDINGSINFKSIVAASTVYSGSALVERIGANRVSADDVKVQFGEHSYLMSGVFDNNGKAQAATVTEVGTNTVLAVDSNEAGERSGTVKNSAGEILGTVEDIGSNSISVNFTEGESIEL